MLKKLSLIIGMLGFVNYLSAQNLEWSVQLNSVDDNHIGSDIHFGNLMYIGRLSGELRLKYKVMSLSVNYMNTDINFSNTIDYPSIIGSQNIQSGFHTQTFGMKFGVSIKPIIRKRLSIEPAIGVHYGIGYETFIRVSSIETLGYRGPIIKGWGAHSAIGLFFEPPELDFLSVGVNFAVYSYRKWSLYRSYLSVRINSKVFGWNKRRLNEAD